MASKEESLTRRSFVAGLSATSLLALTGCDLQLTPTFSKRHAPEQYTGMPDGHALIGTCAHTSSSANPLDSLSVLTLAGARHTYEALYDIDMWSWKPYGALALTTPAKISETEYHVTLRNGAVFSNGNPVTTHDVVHSFDLARQSTTLSPYLDFIENIVVLNNETVSFMLSYPFEELLPYRLSLVKIFPLATSADEEFPIGSGPWIYESFDGQAEGIVNFVPNQNYTGEFEPMGDTMQWLIEPDPVNRTVVLQEARSLVVEDLWPTDLNSVRVPGATIDSVLSCESAYLLFDCTKAPFDNKEIRQAVLSAIDTDYIIDNVLEKNGMPARSFLPKSHQHYHEASMVYEFEPSKAKNTLKAADVSGTTIRLATDGSWVTELVDFIVKDLEDAGFVVEVDENIVDWNSTNNIQWEENGSATPEYHLVLGSEDPSYISPDADWQMRFWYADTPWMNERSHWAQSDYDTWASLLANLDNARSAEPIEQQNIWNQCFDIISEEVPVYPLLHRKRITGWQTDHIANYTPVGIPGLMMLSARPR